MINLGKLEKRPVALFIPYKIIDGDLLVYLQKRSPDQTLPGCFAFWGGGIDEGESLEAALAREVKEELGLESSFYKAEFLNSYEYLKVVDNAFIANVNEDFDSQVVIGEGEYGKWFKASELFDRTDFILQSKVIINDMERILLGKPLR
jgi:mutator protein MutT